MPASRRSDRGAGCDSLVPCRLRVLSPTRAQSKGCCRVHYVAGGRVLAHLGSAYQRASALAGRMNVPIDSLLERYEENVRKSQEHEKAAKALSLEVVALLGETLRARLAAGERVVHVRRPAADAEFVKALATSLEEPLSETKGLLLVTVGEGDGEGSFTLAGPAALVDAASAAVATALEGRGGGKGGRYQGKCMKLGAADAALAAAMAALT
jgi:alanyl-tRNA synthetase